MGNKVVAVLAVHNEEAMLPYTLKQLSGKVDAIVAVLDNCSDRSEAIIRKEKSAYIYRRSGHKWRNYRAEAKDYGILKAKSLFGKCFLLMVDCDIIVDSGSIEKAKEMLENSSEYAVVFTYKQYSLYGSVANRFKDEALNLFGKAVKNLTKQPVVTGIYLIRSEKAVMNDVASDYTTVIAHLNTAWLKTDFKHLRPRYDKHTQAVIGSCRATLTDYNLFKVIVYSFCTFSPFVLSGFLTAKLRGLKTVEDGAY